MSIHRAAAILTAGLVVLAAAEASAASMNFRNCTKDAILLHGYNKIDSINAWPWTLRHIEPGESSQAACIGQVCKVGVGGGTNMQILDGFYSEDHCIVHTGGKYHAYLPSSQTCIQACE